MERAVETIVRLSGERARRLGQLAAIRGVTEEALVAEALDRLFQQSNTPNEDGEDAELLRRMEAETGPAKARIVPPLDPARFVVTHAVPILAEQVRSRGEDC